MGALEADLLDPAAHLAPRPARVELRSTHVSWVFLGEREAIKVKRPVALGFLDFRSLEARRAACEAEVALNARLAPGVYLGVVPVTRDDEGRHAVAGAGEVVDFAVRMRRLDDAARADVLLAEGRLGPAEIDRVAARVARFHAEVGASPRAAAHGRAEAIAFNVREGFAAVGRALDAYVPADEEAAIEAYQLGFLASRAALFDARVAAGRVRDGHGDLRLEHVYFEGDAEPLVLDCIEFSDRFRFADVASDLAFLAMDLAFAGRVDLSERLLARYATLADDVDLFAVVDFYASYRAFVRAKIAHLSATDAALDPETRARAARDVGRYAKLALAESRPPLLGPLVVAVGGLMAAGKSTVAALVGDALGAPVVDADRTRKAMLGVAATTHVDDPAWSGAYDPAFTARVYAEVLRRAGVVLDSGRAVVVDASFRSRELRAAARELARARGVPFRFVECRAPLEVCRARLARRRESAHVSDGRAEILDAFAARYEPVDELRDDELVALDTSRDLDAVRALLLARLPSWPRGLFA